MRDKFFQGSADQFNTAVIASAARQSSTLIKQAFWIALKDSDPLWAEAHVESYAALRSQ